MEKSDIWECDKCKKNEGAYTTYDIGRYMMGDPDKHYVSVCEGCSTNLEKKIREWLEGK